MMRHILITISITLLVGCALIKQESFTISGGKIVSLVVERGWPSPLSGSSMFPSENEEIRIEEVGAYLIDPKRKELTYSFRIQVKNGASLTSVKIEDVSDEQAQLLVDDTQPKLTKAEWVGYATPKKLADRNLRWVLSDQDSIRIYRFIVTMNTEKKTVMYQAVTHSRNFKTFLRRVLVSA